MKLRQLQSPLHGVVALAKLVDLQVALEVVKSSKGIFNNDFNEVIRNTRNVRAWL